MNIALFEIGGASYTSNKIKKSRSYRLRFEWNPADIDDVSSVTTREMRPSVDGEVEWIPLSGLKRLFITLPSMVSVTVQRKTALGIWETFNHHQVSTATSRALSVERIDHVLGLDFVISDSVAGLVQHSGTRALHSESHFPQKLGSLTVSGADHDISVTSGSANPLEIPPLTTSVLTSVFALQ
ncbi:hypothetical protein DL93DRAFT_2085302 [Clavulina sp. PMI_390]|nr:hypothetical protein DL93DRAFT_2085302 [Clavulina sp. PMI_390]